MAVKISAVTMFNSAMVTIGLSPPSSTVLRIRVDAMPVSISTRPNHAPQHTSVSYTHLKLPDIVLGWVGDYTLYHVAHHGKGNADG